MNEGGKDNISPPMDSDYHNRLAEHITGFSFEKMPDLREKIYFDRQKIIEEMGLPSSALLKENPGEYSRRLLEVAETNGITIYTHEDLPEESKEKVADLIKSGSGWYDEELKGVVVADLGTHDQKKLRELTHEIIHAIDFLTRNLGDGISIEEAEYRAYIVSDISKEVLERGDERTANSIIQLFSDGRIAGSCFNYYFQKSEKNFHDFISGLTSGEEKIPWY